MNTAEKLVISPKVIRTNNKIEISIESTNFPTLKNLYIEYSNLAFNNKQLNTIKSTMQKINGVFYFNMVLDEKNDIYFRFYDDNNNIFSSQNEEGFKIENPNVATLALVPIKERGLLYPQKGLRFSYKLNKRIRLLIYKFLRRLPKFITGNYRRRINL